MIRARDVREKCKGRIDPQVQSCIEALAEQQSILFQMLNECAQCIDHMTRIISANVRTQIEQEKMLDKFKKMRGIEKEDDERYEDVTV